MAVDAVIESPTASLVQVPVPFNNIVVVPDTLPVPSVVIPPLQIT